MAKMGRPKSEKPKTFGLNVAMDEELSKMLTEYCSRYNVSKGKVMRIAIKDFIKRDGLQYINTFDIND